MLSPTELPHHPWPALGFWVFSPLMFSPICFQLPQVAFRLDFEFSKSIFLQSMEIYLIANRLMVAFSLARVFEVDGTLPACVGFLSSIPIGDAEGFTRGITTRKSDCHGLLQSVQPCIHKPSYFYLSVYLYPSFFCICGSCAVTARLCAEQKRSPATAAFFTAFTTANAPRKTISQQLCIILLAHLPCAGKVF